VGLRDAERRWLGRSDTQIVMLRNPADRMYSAFYYYGHYGTRYGSDPQGFHTYAQNMVDGFNACVAQSGMSNRCAGERLQPGRERECAAHGAAKKHHSRRVSAKYYMY
jgi:hypothetical protein